MGLIETLEEQAEEGAEIAQVTFFADLAVPRKAETFFLSMVVGRIQHQNACYLLAMQKREEYTGRHHRIPEADPVDKHICVQLVQEDGTLGVSKIDISRYFHTMFNDEPLRYKFPLKPGDETLLFDLTSERIPIEPAGLSELVAVLRDFHRDDSTTFIVPPQLEDNWKDRGGNIYAFQQ